MGRGSWAFRCGGAGVEGLAPKRGGVVAGHRPRFRDAVGGMGRQLRFCVLALTRRMPSSPPSLTGTAMNRLWSVQGVMGFWAFFALNPMASAPAALKRVRGGKKVCVCMYGCMYV